MCDTQDHLPSNPVSDCPGTKGVRVQVAVWVFQNQRLGLLGRNEQVKTVGRMWSSK